VSSAWSLHHHNVEIVILTTLMMVPCYLPARQCHMGREGFKSRAGSKPGMSWGGGMYSRQLTHSGRGWAM
jgi:hypothetical protein